MATFLEAKALQVTLSPLRTRNIALISRSDKNGGHETMNRTDGIESLKTAVTVPRAVNLVVEATFQYADEAIQQRLADSLVTSILVDIYLSLGGMTKSALAGIVIVGKSITKDPLSASVYTGLHITLRGRRGAPDGNNPWEVAILDIGHAASHVYICDDVAFRGVPRVLDVVIVDFSDLRDVALKCTAEVDVYQWLWEWLSYRRLELMFEEVSLLFDLGFFLRHSGTCDAKVGLPLPNTFKLVLHAGIRSEISRFNVALIGRVEPGEWVFQG
jgi:hypothetical protein